MAQPSGPGCGGDRKLGLYQSPAVAESAPPPATTAAIAMERRMDQRFDAIDRRFEAIDQLTTFVAIVAAVLSR
jgi:hypothetical protein